VDVAAGFVVGVAVGCALAVARGEADAGAAVSGADVD